MKSKKPDPKEDAAKRESATSPGRDDVHEQREAAQEREGVVRNPTSARPQRTNEGRGKRSR
jgi:hypothetical protein